MRQNIQIKLLSSGSTNDTSTITNYVTNLDIPTGSTVSDVKNICKSNISGSDKFEVIEEILWLGSKKTKDDDLFKFKSGYEYNIFIKK